MIYEFKDGYLTKHLKYQYIDNNEDWDDFLKRIDFNGTKLIDLLFDSAYGIEAQIDSRNEKNEYIVEITMDGVVDTVFIENFEDYMSFLAKYVPMIDSLINIYRGTIKAEQSILLEHLGK